MYYLVCVTISASEFAFSGFVGQVAKDLWYSIFGDEESAKIFADMVKIGRAAIKNGVNDPEVVEKAVDKMNRKMLKGDMKKIIKEVGEVIEGKEEDKEIKEGKEEEQEEEVFDEDFYEEVFENANEV